MIKKKVKKLDELSPEELKKYNDSKDTSIILHHKDFKGLNVIELYDCKDTDMRKEDYMKLDLPPLFCYSYNDIYTPFVKAIYADGYKISYCDNLDTKFTYDKETKTINIKNGLNCQMKMMCLLDVYSSDLTSSEFEKKLFNYVIHKHIGFDDDFTENNSLLEWYKNTDIKDVEKSLKLLSSKGRKFINNFNRFFDMEKEKFIYEEVSLYDDISFSI